MDSTVAAKVVHKAVRRVIKELDCPLDLLSDLTGESVETTRQFITKRPTLPLDHSAWVKACSALEIDLAFMVYGNVFPTVDTTGIKTVRAELGITELHSILRRISHQRITFAVMGAAQLKLKEWGLTWREVGEATGAALAQLTYMHTLPARAPAVSQVAARVATALSLHLPEVLAGVDVTDEIKRDWLEIHTAMNVSVKQLGPREPGQKRTRNWTVDRAKARNSWLARKEALTARHMQPPSKTLRSYPPDGAEIGMGYTDEDIITSAEIDKAAPKNRSECIDGPRPCPWYRCRYNTGSDFKHPRGGAPRVKFFDSPLRWTDTMPSNCALDHAERGGMTLDEVGDVLGVSRERVRQMEENALNKLLASGYDFTALLGEGQEIIRNIKPENNDILNGNPTHARHRLTCITEQARLDAAQTARAIPLDTEQARLIVQGVERELSNQKTRRHDLPLTPTFVDRSILGKPAKGKPIINAQSNPQSQGFNVKTTPTKVPQTRPMPPVENIPTITLKPIPQSPQKPQPTVTASTPAATPDRTHKAIVNAAASVLASVISDTGLTRGKMAERSGIKKSILDKMLIGKSTHWTSPNWVVLCNSLLIAPGTVAARAQMTPSETVQWFSMIGYNPKSQTPTTHGSPLADAAQAVAAAAQTKNPASITEANQKIQSFTESIAPAVAGASKAITEATERASTAFNRLAAIASTPVPFNRTAPPSPSFDVFADDEVSINPIRPTLPPLALHSPTEFNRAVEEIQRQGQKAMNAPNMVDIIGTAQDKALLSPESAPTRAEYAEAVLGEALAKIKAYQAPIDYRAKYSAACDEIMELMEKVQYLGERLEMNQHVLKCQDEKVDELQLKLNETQAALIAKTEECQERNKTVLELKQAIANLHTRAAALK